MNEDTTAKTVASPIRGFSVPRLEKLLALPLLYKVLAANSIVILIGARNIRSVALPNHASSCGGIPTMVAG